MQLPATQLGSDIKALVERGDLSLMSFGFFVPPGGDAWHREGARTIRTLKKVELFEVSLVALPAYPQTIVMLRIALDTMLAAVLVARRRRLEALVV